MWRKWTNMSSSAARTASVWTISFFTNIINQWNDDYAQKGVDFQSHVNDAEPYVTSTADFFALQSRVTYGDVAITLKVKKGNIQPEEQGGAGAQGVLLMFGNEFVQLKIKRDGSIETSWDSLWGSYTNAIEEYMPGSNTWWLYNEDGSVKWNTGAGVALTDEETALLLYNRYTYRRARRSSFTSTANIPETWFA